MLSPIRVQCLLASLCLGALAARTKVRLAADALAAATGAADGGARSVVAAAARHAANHAETVPQDGENFVFVEVYQLKGSDLFAVSAAISGNDVADELLQVAGNTSEAQAANTSQAQAAALALYHSEVTICPRASFSTEQARYLTKMAGDMSTWRQLSAEWWNEVDVLCEGVSYGSGGIEIYEKYLSQSVSGITNADLVKVWKYFYGTTDRKTEDVINKLTTGKCDGYWADDCYHPVFQNCNYWTNAMISCGFELSWLMPPLGVSVTKKVMSCKCRPPFRRTWCPDH